MTARDGKGNGPTRTTADRPDVTPDDRRHTPNGDMDVDGVGDPWRGPSEARWIARLLRGAPPPRDSAPSPAGLVAHG